ncbi:MAG TPA: zinc-binding dehydrogenase, partial [Acidimicrobiales bacterium]|nr:zinc-binding dehydrogenase [Acidimicrobiales bacterium]
NIIAIDPVEAKHDLAKRFGATHTVGSLGEAHGLIQQVTWGRMCEKIICCVGVGSGEQIAPIMTLCAKRGRVVVTNIHPASEGQVSLSLVDLTLMEKQLVGTIFGSANPQSDIPRLLHLHRAGQLDLAGMVTKEYELGDINQGFEDMLAGRNIRGVIRYT